MATTRISDAFVPAVWTKYDVLNSIRKNAFIVSGIAANVSMLDDFLNGGGSTINVPRWNTPSGLDSTFVWPDLASDDPTEDSTPDKITAAKDIAMRQVITKSWSSMELTGALIGSDPMDAIITSREDYYNAYMNKALIASSVGVINDSVASHSSDLVNDIAVAPSGTIGATNKISGSAIIDTLQTMGDQKDMLTGIAVHSAVHAQMQKQNLIDAIPNAEANIGFGTYLGKTIIVDDDLPFEIYDTDKVKYTSVLYGVNAFAMARSFPTNGMRPNSVDFDESAGNGSGQETLYTRRQAIVHPYGYQFDTSTVISGGYYAATEAQLETASLWTRSYTNRKRIKIAALISNGD